MRGMRSLITVLLAVSFAVACSTRLVHQPTVLTASPNAININAAAVDELERLPGVGLKTAEAIVEYRTTNGPFRRVEHLMLIRGVSEERFFTLRPLLRAE